MPSICKQLGLIASKSANEQKRRPLLLCCQCCCPLTLVALLALVFSVIENDTFGYTINVASYGLSTPVSSFRTVRNGPEFMAQAKKYNLR